MVLTAATLMCGPPSSSVKNRNTSPGHRNDRVATTAIGDNHKPKVVGSVGESKEIQTKIKKEDWNAYHITAKGFDFTHRINGVVTCQCTDEDAEQPCPCCGGPMRIIEVFDAGSSPRHGHEPEAIDSS